MAKKFDAKKFKEEFDALDPDEQEGIREALKSDDGDDTDFKKTVLARLTSLEGLLKGKRADGEPSFFDRVFGPKS